MKNAKTYRVIEFIAFLLLVPREVAFCTKISVTKSYKYAPHNKEWNGGLNQWDVQSQFCRKIVWALRQHPVFFTLTGPFKTVSFKETVISCVGLGWKRMFGLSTKLIGKFRHRKQFRELNFQGSDLTQGESTAALESLINQTWWINSSSRRFNEKRGKRTKSSEQRKAMSKQQNKEELCSSNPYSNK